MERINFTLVPPARQSCEVLFQSEHTLGDGNPYHDDTSDDFWTAAKILYPWMFEDFEMPLEGYGGWSSVLPDGRITEVVDDTEYLDLGEPGDSEIPRLCETFEYGMNGYNDRPSSYRITSFYKSHPTNRELKEHQCAIVQCKREEAEFVNGSGLCGCVRPIKGLKITGRVSWDDRTIAKERRSYDERYTEPLPDHLSYQIPTITTIKPND